MPTYNCEICNISTKIKTHYIRHLKTKKHIKNAKELSSKNGENILNSLPNILNSLPNSLPPSSQSLPNIPNSPKYVCDVCGALFSRKDNLKRHKVRNCGGDTNVDYKELFYEMKSELKKEKEDSKQKMEFLLKKVGNTTTINNKQNIQLNSYGNEDLSHITDLLKNELLKIPYAMIPKLIEAVHFNDEKPENKNICLPNKKDNLIKVYQNNKWIYKTKDETITDLVDSKYMIMDSHYEKCDKSNLSHFIKMNYDKFRKYYDEGDKELEENIKKECDLILLNNR